MLPLICHCPTFATKDCPIHGKNATAGISEVLRQEAAACEISAGKNPSPTGEIFHGMFIMLSSLAERLEPKDNEPTAGPGMTCQCTFGNSKQCQIHGEASRNMSKPQEVGGTHYQEGVKVSPWSLQKEMQSSGNAFVDARRADTIKYTFRMKGGLNKLLEDMRKAQHCLTAGIEELERHVAEETAKMQDAAGKQSISPSLPKA